MVVLSVDVGLRACGYVICGVKGLKTELIREGQIKPNPKEALPQKLNYIFEFLAGQIDRYTPQALIVEKLYSHYRHPATLGVLAQVRGIIALLARRKGIDFFEYSPRRARQSFLGRGSANSGQVKKMAEGVTGRKFNSAHSADAFSLVVAFSHDQKVRKILKGAL